MHRSTYLIPLALGAVALSAPLAAHAQEYYDNYSYAPQQTQTTTTYTTYSQPQTYTYTTQYAQPVYQQPVYQPAYYQQPYYGGGYGGVPFALDLSFGSGGRGGWGHGGGWRR